LRDFASDFAIVFGALMDKPLPELKGKTVRQLIPYTVSDNAAIRTASDYLETGRDHPGNMDARLVLAAARLAVTRSGRNGQELKAKLQSINDRTMRLVGDNAPKGVLASVDPGRRNYIRGFAKTISTDGKRSEPRTRAKP
jgi:hypothetical protein